MKNTDSTPASAHTGIRSTPPVRGERGVALLVVLFAISAFSALAVTLLTDKALEAALASGSQLTVSAPGQHASALKAPWPFTIARTKLGESELEVRIPVSADFVPELPVGASTRPGGWRSVVQVVPGVRVCCDGGDGQCRNRPLEETTRATPDPALDLSFAPGSPTQSLMCSLLTGGGSQASGAASQPAFYTSTPNRSSWIQPPSCRRESSVAARRRAAESPCASSKKVTCPDGSDRVLQGTLRLDYLRPSGSQ